MSRARNTTALVAALVLALAPAARAAEPPRASLTQIERQVMCVTCKIPLNVAQSPQADRERAYIQSLIDEGKNEAEIKSAMVAQYGSTVLGLPPDHGFDVAAYLVPLAAVLALGGLLAVLLPRWRRRSRARPEEPPAPLPDADAARLESDLARFD
jgi:cytochrome c-type biogenesis protein CcmH/NrfF